MHSSGSGHPTWFGANFLKPFIALISRGKRNAPAFEYAECIASQAAFNFSATSTAFPSMYNWLAYCTRALSTFADSSSRMRPNWCAAANSQNSLSFREYIRLVFSDTAFSSSRVGFSFTVGTCLPWTSQRARAVA